MIFSNIDPIIFDLKGILKFADCCRGVSPYNFVIKFGSVADPTRSVTKVSGHPAGSTQPAQSLAPPFHPLVVAVHGPLAGFLGAGGLTMHHQPSQWVPYRIPGYGPPGEFWRMSSDDHGIRGGPYRPGPAHRAPFRTGIRPRWGQGRPSGDLRGRRVCHPLLESRFLSRYSDRGKMKS